MAALTDRRRDRPLLVEDLGRLAWIEALARQEEAHAAVRAGGADRLLLVEHPPTVTIGRSAEPAHLLLSPERLAARGIALHEASRGGSVTYHGPGQLVGYPILDLRRRGLGLHRALRLLEEALIEALDELGVEAFAREGLTGVWTAEGKVAAIGIAVRRGITLHGFALNLAPEPGLFELIVPCGLAGERVTSVRELGVQTTRARAARAVARALEAALAAECR